MKMKAAVLTVCGAPRPFAKSKPIHVVEVDLDPPGEGEVLVKVACLSLDPYQRGRMRDAASYSAPVGLNEVMTGGTVGEVVASHNPHLKVGDIVEDRLGDRKSVV